MNKTFEIKKTDIVALVFTAVSIFFVCRFGIIGAFNFGFALTIGVLLTVGYVYLNKKHGSNKIFSFLLFVCALLLCASFALIDSSLMKFCVGLYLPFLGAFIFCAVSGNVSPENGTYKIFADTFMKTFDGLFIKLDSLLKSFGEAVKNGKSKKLVYGLIGAGVSVPIVCVILPLLISSDIAFGNMMGRLVEDFGALIFALVFTACCTPCIYSLMIALKKGTVKETGLKSSIIKVESVVFNVLLGVISVVYSAYLFSQLAYISKAFAFLLPSDYSAAEFARSGFFEMGAIAFINCLILGTTVIIIKRNNGKLPKITKSLLVYLILFTCFYISTALVKMFKYITLYGLTTMRVLTSVFMLMLGILFIIFLLKLMVPKMKYIRAVLLVCTVALIAVSVVDINAVIAEYNYSQYKKGNIEIDVEQIAFDLGASGVPTLVKLTEDENEDVSKMAKYYLLYYGIEEFYTNALDDYSVGKIGLELCETAFYGKNLAWIRAKKAVDYFVEKSDLKPGKYEAFISDYESAEYEDAFEDYSDYETIT